MPLAYVPVYGSGLPPTGMTLAQRAENSVTFGAIKAINIFVTAPMVKAMWCDTPMPLLLSSASLSL